MAVLTRGPTQGANERDAARPVLDDDALDDGELFDQLSGLIQQSWLARRFDTDGASVIQSFGGGKDCQHVGNLPDISAMTMITCVSSIGTP